MAQKLIKTEEYYRQTLDRIDQLMCAKPTTPEFDELELLSALVEIYEDEHYPIDIPDPVSAIKFRMEQLGLSQQNLVPFIGNRSKVSEVLNRKRPLTLAMMRALHKGLGIPTDVLLQGPDTYSLDNIPELEYEKFPINEMAKNGWISRIPDMQGHAEEIIRKLISNAGGMKAVEGCLCRKTIGSRENAKNDPYALQAWCLKVLEVANSNSLSTQYKKGTINEEFLRDIAKLSYFEKGPSLAKEYLEKHGIHLVTLPHLSKTYLDGAVMLLPNQTPVIGLTLRHDHIDNFWFCLLHELAHISKHLSGNSSEIIIDDLDLRGYENDAEDTKEQEADSMAQEALIPSDYMKTLNLAEGISSMQVKELAEKWNVHCAIIAGRIRYEKNNYKILSRLLGYQQIRNQFFIASPTDT